jgi:hypothetical protein
VCASLAATEQWSVVDEELKISSSAVDIFTMLTQSLPMVIDSGLLLDEQSVATLVQNVDGMVRVCHVTIISFAVLTRLSYS